MKKKTFLKRSQVPAIYKLKQTADDPQTERLINLIQHTDRNSPQLINHFTSFAGVLHPIPFGLMTHKLANQFQRTKFMMPSTEKHFSTDSEHGSA